MDFRCSQGQQLIKKEDKNSQDFKKNKFFQNPFASILLSNRAQFLSTQSANKYQNSHFCQEKHCYQGQGQGQNILFIDVNAIVIKKNKNKKDFANIKYYNC